MGKRMGKRMGRRMAKRGSAVRVLAAVCAATRNAQATTAVASTAHHWAWAVALLLLHFHHHPHHHPHHRHHHHHHRHSGSGGSNSPMAAHPPAPAIAAANRLLTAVPVTTATSRTVQLWMLRRAKRCCVRQRCRWSAQRVWSGCSCSLSQSPWGRGLFAWRRSCARVKGTCS